MKRSWAFAALLLVAACKSDPPPSSMGPTQDEIKARDEAGRLAARPVLDKHAPMVKAKQAAAIAVATDAKAAPPVTALEPLASPLAFPLALKVDTLVAAPELLLDRDAKAPLPFYPQPSFAAYLDWMGPDSGVQTAPDQLEAELGGLAAVKYALMVRVRAVQPSTVTTVMVGGQGELRYQAGTATGDAILYELDTGKRLGAFPFSLAAEGEFQSKTGLSAEEEATKLMEHLHGSVTRQLGDLLGALATGKDGGGAAPIDPGGAAAAQLTEAEQTLLAEVTRRHVGALPDKVTITPGARPVVTIEASNPTALSADDIAAMATFAGQLIGADVDVKVVATAK